jgi:hypothetical protein
MVRPLAGALALTLLTLAGDPAAADDKTDDKAKPAPAGVWVREASGFDVTVEFVGKDGVSVSAMHDGNGVTAVCKYTAGKDGVVKAKITDVKVKGEFPNKPPVGLEFSFKWAVKGDTATLDDLTGKELENAKPVLEGEYDRKKEKAKKK